MKTTKRILAATSALLLLGAATLPAAALDVNVGGSGGSNVLSLGGGAGQAGATLAVTNTDGNLASLNQTGTTADGTVNLGGAGLGGLGLNGLGLDGLGLGGVDVGGLLPGGGVGGIGGIGGNGGNGTDIVRVSAAFSSYSSGEQQQLRLRCRSVMASPTAFDPSLVALCRMIARIGQPQ